MSKIALPPSGLAEDVLGKISEASEEMQLVTFSLGEHYGIPIGQVQEIIRVGPITRVPNSPVYMEGVINLRGRVLSVLNLRKRLSLPPREIGKESRVIVTEVIGKTIGLLVDSVSHVIRVPAECIERAPEEVLEVESDYIAGVCKLKNALVILIDLEKLLKRESVDIKEGQDAAVSARVK